MLSPVTPFLQSRTLEVVLSCKKSSETRKLDQKILLGGIVCSTYNDNAYLPHWQQCLKTSGWLCPPPQKKKQITDSML